MKRRVKYCVEICIVIIVTSCVTSYLNINLSTMKMRVANRHECMSLRNDVIGPGENGTGIELNITLLSQSDRQKYDEGKKKHFYNDFTSDLISIHRSLPSTLVEEQCRTRRYVNLSPVSVIIPFRDETWNVLLRTMHSILDRTPPDLLKEIVLVDDGSKEEYLKERLDIYLSHLQKVRVIRHAHSMGLMVARQRGIDESLTDIIVVMDSHMEVAEAWLEPLLQTVIDNPRSLVTPKVETIDPETFKYHYSQLFIGAITYSFDFRLAQTLTPFRTDYLLSRENFKLSNVRIPSIQGNIFVANKTFFMELGGIDTGMRVWGAEQIELSIKYITCGTGIVMVPCSHVGHLYKTAVAWRDDDSVISNEYRVAEVWMDQYKHYVFESNGNYSYETGDISNRKEIRQKNDCKPFTYFLKTIQEFVHFYVPENRKAHGMVRLSNTNLCLDDGSGYLEVWNCLYRGGIQYWEWSEDLEIRHFVQCLTTGSDDEVMLVPCDFQRYIKWHYQDDNLIRHIESNRCLTVFDSRKVRLASCIGSNEQQWIWNRQQYHLM